jgi:hypothetical protein
MRCGCRAVPVFAKMFDRCVRTVGNATLNSLAISAGEQPPSRRSSVRFSAGVKLNAAATESAASALNLCCLVGKHGCAIGRNPAVFFVLRYMSPPCSRHQSGCIIVPQHLTFSSRKNCHSGCVKLALSFKHGSPVALTQYRKLRNTAVPRSAMKLRRAMPSVKWHTTDLKY